MSIEENNLLQKVKDYKESVLDNISPTFCTAKWKQVTLHLHNGLTHSCHHPRPHKIPLDEVNHHPSALHNTSWKKLARKEMLEGKRPSECDYCWKVEDNNDSILSDRMFKSYEWWAQPYVNAIINSHWKKNVNPSYLEVSFSSVCNFKCSYCSPQVSSKWMEEINQYGPYPTSSNLHDLSWLKRHDHMPIPNKEHNPYVEAFWKWWPTLANDLKHFRITGGEPLLTKDTFKILDDLILNPKPDLEFSINSNLCPTDEIMNKFVEKIKIIGGQRKVKKLKIFTSAEAYGDQANYIRYGLDYNKWLHNIRRILIEVPNCTFTCTSTFNVLSIFSFDKFLKDILELKLEFGGPSKAIPIILDTPYLRWPKHQTIFIGYKNWLEYFTKSRDFIQNNLEYRNIRGKENYGFYSWELAKFQRIVDIFKDNNFDSVDLQQHRNDFIIFVDEHDRRRDTNFLQTFPKMYDFYWDNKK